MVQLRGASVAVCKSSHLPPCRHSLSMLLHWLVHAAEGVTSMLACSLQAGSCHFQASPVPQAPLSPDAQPSVLREHVWGRASPLLQQPGHRTRCIQQPQAPSSLFDGTLMARRCPVRYALHSQHLLVAARCCHAAS